MDVICDRCKAEYEFDEALLGDKGTTVKCSACGHVFRVLPPNRDASRSQLKLRLHKDGSVKSLGSLRELQQRIRAGEVSLDDELGRDGFPFRLLRDVPELKNFFMSAPPPDMSAPVERTTARPEASRAAPLPDPPTRTHDRVPEARARAFATVARDAGATAVPTGETLLGTAPTARGSLRGPGATREPEARPPAPQRAAQTAAGEPAQPPAHAEQPQAPTSPESRSRSFSKHTMMGVGPEDLQLPPPPRVPQFAAGPGRPAAPPAERAGAAGARAPGQPGAGKPSAPNPVRERTQPASHDSTLHGIPVIAPAPAPGGQHAAAGKPGAGLPPLKPSVRPASAFLDRGGTMSPISAAAAAAVAAEPPHQAEPPRQHAAASAATGRGPGGPAAESPYAAGPSAHEARPEPAPRRGVAPFDVASSAFPLVEGEVERLPNLKAPRTDASLASGSSARFDAGPAPKLYLDDDERPPERATESSSKIWLYVAAALVVGGGVYVGVTRLHVLGQPTGEPAPAVAPQPSAGEDAGLAQNGADAGAGAAPAAEAQGAYPAPEFAPPVGGAEPSAGASPGEPAVDKAAADKPSAGEPPAAKPGREKSTAEEPADKSSSAKPAADKPERSSSRAAAEPQDYSGWVSRGDQLFSKGDHDGASKAFKAALALRPSGSEANAGLGFALLNASHARESLPYFDRASSSGYAEANIGLGDAYRKLGQPSSAKEAYQAYLDRLPTGARADYARSALDKLKVGGSADKPAADKPAADKPSSPASDYRPAGELIEPSAPPPTTTPPAPSETPP